MLVTAEKRINADRSRRKELNRSLGHIKTIYWTYNAGTLTKLT